MMGVQLWQSTTNRTKEGSLEGAKVLLNCPGKTRYYAIMCSQTMIYLVKDDGVDKFWRGVTGFELPRFSTPTVFLQLLQ